MPNEIGQTNLVLVCDQSSSVGQCMHDAGLQVSFGITICLFLTHHSTHNRSFRGQIFPGNQLHLTDNEKVTN